ncbi:MAG: hypothetical protein LAO20_14205 [Acidobacteriia bacterium]|nr:hypothetical protein [Terriglobia bacterium]
MKDVNLKTATSAALATIVILLLCGLGVKSCNAEDLPDAPQAKPQPVHAGNYFPEHRFLDKSNTFALGAMVSLRATDAVITCRVLKTGRWEEGWLSTNSCRGVATFNAIFSALGAGGAYLLHRTGHHKLERIPMWISAGGSAAGIAQYAQQRSRGF